MATSTLLRASGVGRKIRPVTKASISDEIVEQIMGLIESGDLRPGQRLPSERELCVRFGTGRSSLREALRCLSIVGVLHARVGEGTSVAVDGAKFLGKILQWRLITEQHDVENLMEVRRSLEGLAAARVAVHGSDADHAMLEALVARQGNTLNEGGRRFPQLDLDFHLAIARASDNPLLTDMISMIRGQLEKGVQRVLVAPGAIPLSYKEHQAILKAIQSRDPETAREAMEAHLDNAIVRYDKLLGETAAAMSGEEPKPSAKKAAAKKRARIAYRSTGGA